MAKRAAERSTRQCWGPCTIEPPFSITFGMNTKLGDRVCANTNLMIHDHALVVIGSNVKIGLGVGLLTEGHPVDNQERAEGAVPRIRSSLAMMSGLERM
jgi:acetyltransferase-like isoleucine patch superfamily enzyme